MSPNSKATPFCVIQRDHDPSETSPPWDGIIFKPRIGSDQLSESLKNLYPALRSLRQRKHRALIDFLLAELRAMQMEDERQTSPQCSAELQPSNSPRSGLPDTPRDSSTSQSACSPSMAGSPSPWTASPIKQGKDMKDNLQPRPSSPSAGGQHFVFNVVDGRPMQPKSKRKMSAQERLAYKETRRRGACDKCKRTKAKCTHIADAPNDAEPSLQGSRSESSLDYGHKLPPSLSLQEHLNLSHVEESRHDSAQSLEPAKLGKRTRTPQSGPPNELKRPRGASTATTTNRSMALDVEVPPPEGFDIQLSKTSSPTSASSSDSNDNASSVSASSSPTPMQTPSTYTSPSISVDTAQS